MSDEQGKAFEKRIRDEALLANVTCAEIPNKFVGYYSGRPKQVATPFDFALGIDGKAVFLEAKACGDLCGFNFKSKVLAPEKIHQYNHLIRAQECGNKAGYLIHFYKAHRIVWLPVEHIHQIILNEFNGVKPGDCLIQEQSDETPIKFREIFWEPVLKVEKSDRYGQ